MKLISYNIEKHRAAEELSSLISTTGASSLCIQEARVTELPESIERLSLVASTPQNRLGLAIYVAALYTGDEFIASPSAAESIIIVVTEGLNGRCHGLYQFIAFIMSVYIICFFQSISIIEEDGKFRKP